ncbi:hypothetical protein [Pseudomonas sp. LRF_L74]|uniref:hypothetical protein n=1 Tax=Pseudomonas sp. LRF_L74 TaxID=3369422 RepID=UPI003F60C372
MCNAAQGQEHKPRRPLAKHKKRIRTRKDLSFTRMDPHPHFPGRELFTNWVTPDSDKDTIWSDELDIGLAMSVEIAELARSDMREAYLAVQCALTSEAWRTEGWGQEYGFASGVAVLAMFGLQYLEVLGEPFDPERQQQNLLKRKMGVREAIAAAGLEVKP